jgi:hypothetical protein
MDKPTALLAVALRWLAGLWLVGWTLYLVFWAQNWLSTMEGVKTGLATLLLPPAFAFGVSCGLDRLSARVGEHRKVASGS